MCHPHIFHVLLSPKRQTLNPRLQTLGIPPIRPYIAIAEDISDYTTAHHPRYVEYLPAEPGKDAFDGSSGWETKTVDPKPDAEGKIDGEPIVNGDNMVPWGGAGLRVVSAHLPVRLVIPPKFRIAANNEGTDDWCESGEVGVLKNFASGGNEVADLGASLAPFLAQSDGANFWRAPILPSSEDPNPDKKPVPGWVYFVSSTHALSAKDSKPAFYELSHTSFGIHGRPMLSTRGLVMEKLDVIKRDAGGPGFQRKPESKIESASAMSGMRIFVTPKLPDPVLFWRGSPDWEKDDVKPTDGRYFSYKSKRMIRLWQVFPRLSGNVVAPFFLEAEFAKLVGKDPAPPAAPESGAGDGAAAPADGGDATVAKAPASSVMEMPPSAAASPPAEQDGCSQAQEARTRLAAQMESWLLPTPSVCTESVYSHAAFGASGREQAGLSADRTGFVPVSDRFETGFRRQFQVSAMPPDAQSVHVLTGTPPCPVQMSYVSHVRFLDSQHDVGCTAGPGVSSCRICGQCPLRT